MKKLILIAIGIFAAGHVFAQANSYSLSTGADVYLAPGQQIPVNLLYKGKSAPTGGAQFWNVNGESATAQDPANGHLAIKPLSSAATYTAPAKAPPKNPVLIACAVLDNGKITVLSRVFIVPNYHIELRLEANGHNEKGGALHCEITGEGDMIFKNGGWQDGQMTFKVKDLTYANPKSGFVYLKSPRQFNNAFQISANLCDSSTPIQFGF